MNERANYFSCSVSFIHSSVVRRQPPSDVVPSLSAPCSYVHPKKMTLHPSSACLHKVRLTRRSEKASVSETGGETVQDTHVRDWLWFKRKLLKRGNNTNIRFIYFFTTFYRPFILTYLFESTCLQHRPALCVRDQDSESPAVQESSPASASWDTEESTPKDSVDFTAVQNSAQRLYN